MKKLRIILIAIAIILIPLMIYFAKDNHENENINYDIVIYLTKEEII